MDDTSPHPMHIRDAQQEIRTHFIGGFWGQLVSGVLWVASAALATWSSPRSAIVALVVGGFFIFPLTVLCLRLSGRRTAISADNTLYQLGTQVALVLPLSMPLLLAVGRYKLNWFYPGMMILLGAHYLPFVFLYGMRMFAVLCAVLVSAGVVLALYAPSTFAGGAWLTAGTLLTFAVAGRRLALARPPSRDT